MIRIHLVLSFCLIVCFFAKSQEDALKEKNTNPFTDSLYSLIDPNRIDTQSVNEIHDLAFELKNLGRIGESRKLIIKALSIAQELNWNKGRAKCYNVIGLTYTHQSIYDSALLFLDKGMMICDSFNLTSVKGTIHLNISNVHSEKSDYAATMKHLVSALGIFEKLRDKERIAGAMVNMGIVYFYQNAYDTAIAYYERSIEIYEELESEKNLSFCYMNIGACYAYQGKMLESLQYFYKTAQLKKRSGELNGLCIAYQNIAEIEAHLSDMSLDSLKKLQGIERFSGKGDIKQNLLDSAKFYLVMGIEIAESINSPINMISGLSTLSNIYAREGNYEKALQILKEEIKKAQTYGLKQNEMDAYKHVNEIYEAIEKFDSALVYYKKYAQVKDSIFSKEKQTELGREEARYKFEKEKAIKEAEYQHQIQLDQFELKRQKLFQGLLGIIILAIGGISVVIYRALKVSKKQRQEIFDQKKLIEKKNLEILSSIRYASRIQNALLKDENMITPSLPKHFVMFKPRDIVSGDFYWSVKQDHWWYLAVADCTGHGVPGAFLTMLGTAYLNEIISSKEHISPDEILFELRKKIVNQLSQSENIEDSKDGMDISLIALNLNSLEAEWAGAQNPIYIIQPIDENSDSQIKNENFELIEHKGDKQPIGYHSKQVNFTLKKLKFNKGDSFYMLSDGFPDQFGGPKNKKYRYKPLKEFILNHSQKSVEDQKTLFEKEFEDWKGNNDQLDDVCLIGVKL